jgi:hypothetical protein
MPLEGRPLKHYHVFLASPGDVPAEREHVRKFFSDYNRDTAHIWGVHFDVIDYENYGTIGVGRPQDLITRQTLEKYRDSLALVVGIMAQRFGSPSGKHHSGTEEEFIWAMESYKRHGYPEIKWFFRKIDQFVAPPDRRKLKEALRQWDKVCDFRKRLEEFGNPVWFKEYAGADRFSEVFDNDLRLWLRDSAREWVTPRAPTVSSGSPLIAQFALSAASTEFRRRVSNFVKLYLGTAGSPVPFGGRARELEALNAWLEGREEGNSPPLLGGEPASNNLLITAPPGRGKTALLVRWIEKLQAGWPLVFVPVSIRAETNQALAFYQAFAARLAEILGEALPEPRSDPVAYYRQKSADYLERLGTEGHKCLIVIDGLDEARGWKMDTTILPAEPGSNLKIVISARDLAEDKGPQNWLERLGWLPPVSSARTLPVPPLTRKGIADVLANMDFPVAQLSTDVDIVDELYRLSEAGDPLVLHYYAKDLLRQGDAAARLKPDDLRGLKPGFGAYIKKWLDEQKAEWSASGMQVDEELLDAILAVLAGAIGPLKLAELEELVNRVLPGNRIFSVSTIDPLRRFIVGDGRENGYALAHPKLAEFLQRDYFAGSKIVRVCHEAFISWMRDIVQSLNRGERAASETPTYALLFFTQHLAAMSSGAALEHYRDLLENGWRKAWEHHEGGFQSFSRDIELASRAFRAAADGNPEQLRMPRTGLGAQVRCALCLSSIRSIGLSAGGEVLAEFVRSGSLTPRQALYLAQLKEDKQRARALAPLVELLPTELRLEAYASALDTADPQARFELLLAVGPHLPEPDRGKAFLKALETFKLLTMPSGHARALAPFVQSLPTKLRLEAYAAALDIADAEMRFELLLVVAPHLPDDDREKAFLIALETSGLLKTPDERLSARGRLKRLVPAEAWAEADAAEKARRDAEEHAAEQVDILPHGPQHIARSADAPSKGVAWETLVELYRETLEGDLSASRIQHILDITLAALAEEPSRVRMIIESLAPRLSREHQIAVLYSISRDDGLFRDDILTALTPFLPPDLLQEVVRIVAETSMFGLEKPLKAVAARLDEAGLAEALQRIQNMRDEYRRTKAIGAVVHNLPTALLSEVVQWSQRLEGYYARKTLEVVAPYLPPPLLLEAVRWSLELKSYDAGVILKVLAPHVSSEELIRLLRSVDVKVRGALLEAGAAKLPEDFLVEAVRLASEVPYADERAGILAQLMPRVPHAELAHLIQTARIGVRASLLGAYASTMPEDFLPEAVKLVSEVGDVEERGGALVKLLPRLREARLSSSITDAYLTAFVIGDGRLRVLANAALARHLDERFREQCLEDVRTELDKTSHDQEALSRIGAVLAVALIARSLPHGQATSILDAAVSAVRHIAAAPELRAIALGLLSAQLRERGAELMKEAMDVGRTSTEAAVVLPILAAFLAPQEMEAALRSVQREVERDEKHDEQRQVSAFIVEVVLALTSGSTASEMATRIREAGKAVGYTEEDDCLTALLVLMFGPKFSAGEVTPLVRNALTGLGSTEDLEQRSMMLVALAPYLPPTHLWPCMRESLDTAARLPRPAVLTGLALMQGCVKELFARNPDVGGNQIAESPLARLGGTTAVKEAVDAVRDVCSWWP